MKKFLVWFGIVGDVFGIFEVRFFIIFLVSYIICCVI